MEKPLGIGTRMLKVTLDYTDLPRVRTRVSKVTVLYTGLMQNLNLMSFFKQMMSYFKATKSNSENVNNRALSYLLSLLSESVRRARRGTPRPEQAVVCSQRKQYIQLARSHCQRRSHGHAVASCSSLMVVSFVHSSSQELDPSA